ncbi:recombinase family protein, partial [Escherichia coli]
MKIGYARKSTHLQDVAHQVDELTKAGCEQIYQDQRHCCKVSDEAAFCL